MKRTIKAAWFRIINAYAIWRYNARLSEDSFEPITDTNIAPPITHEMKMRGTTWAKSRVPDSDGVPDFVWVEVCDTCGGNCGQCGMTERLGNPGFSLDRIIAKTGMNNPVNGLGAARQK